VNYDIAIHRLALSQSRTLGSAQLMVAKLRNDVELQELRSSGLQPDQKLTNADGIADAFSAVAAQSRPRAITPEAGNLIDKLA
jgi:hypothetical protein